MVVLKATVRDSGEGPAPNLTRAHRHQETGGVYGRPPDHPPFHPPADVRRTGKLNGTPHSNLLRSCLHRSSDTPCVRFATPRQTTSRTHRPYRLAGSARLRVIRSGPQPVLSARFPVSSPIWTNVARWSWRCAARSAPPDSRAPCLVIFWLPVAGSAHTVQRCCFGCDGRERRRACAVSSSRRERWARAAVLPVASRLTWGFSMAE